MFNILARDPLVKVVRNRVPQGYLASSPRQTLDDALDLVSEFVGLEVDGHVPDLAGAPCDALTGMLSG